MYSRKVYGINVSVALLIVVCIFLICVYGLFLRSTKSKDILANDIFDTALIRNINGWSVTHFAFFFLLGILYPRHHLAALSAGIVWEYIEQTLGTNVIKIGRTRIQLVGDQQNGISTGNDDAYWYGKTSDIIVNILGYCIGDLFAPCPGGDLPCER